MEDLSQTDHRGLAAQDGRVPGAVGVKKARSVGPAGVRIYKT